MDQAAVPLALWYMLFHNQSWSSSVWSWHLACPSISLIVNYSQNMELGWFRPAEAIIKQRGVAESIAGMRTAMPAAPAGGI